MKTIGPHTTPNAGTFDIAYDETPNLKDPRYIVLLYYITAPSGQVFRIALVALRAFISDVATAIALMESAGLVRLKTRLDSMDAEGYMIDGPGLDLSGGFSLNPVGPDTADEPIY